MRHGPESGALPVEPQSACKPVQPLEDVLAAVAELVGPDNRSEGEFPFANQRLGVN